MEYNKKNSEYFDCVNNKGKSLSAELVFDFNLRPAEND
jgi:hypothetical protein